MAAQSQLAAQLAVADAQCATISHSSFDLSLLPVSWTTVDGRNEPLLRLLRLAANSSSSFDQVMNEDGGYDDLRSYIEAVGFVLIFPIVVAALSLILCGFPLWISRCCAHRCCKHATQPYKRKHRRATVGCFALMSLTAAAFVIIGCLAGAAAVPAVEQTLCSVDGFFRNSTSFLYGVDDFVDTLTGLTLDAKANLTGMSDDLTCLSNTFGPTGAVTVSCAAVTSARVAAADIDTRVQQITGGTAARDLSPEWGSLEQQLQDTEALLCTSLAGLKPGVDEAISAVSDITLSVKDANSGLSSMYTDLVARTNDWRHSHSEYLTWQADILRHIKDGYAYIGVAVFLPHLLLFALGAIGAFMMLRRPVDKCCSVNGAGVQVAGFGWVQLTLLAPVLCLLAAICATGACLMSDTGYLLLEVPRDPTFMLGQDVCERNTVTFGDGQPLSPCSLVSNCFATPSVSLWSTLAPSLNFNLTDISSQITRGIDASGFADGSPFNVTELTLGATQAQQMVDELSTLSAADTFNIPPSDPNGPPIDADLATMVANLTTATNAITGSTDLACAIGVEGLVAVLLQTVDTLLIETSTDVLDTTFSCGFIAYNLDAVIQPSLTGTVRDSMGGTALCLLLATICCLLAVPPLIAMQMQYGDVGIEPGCPSCCRRCCCYRPGANIDASRLAEGGDHFGLHNQGGLQMERALAQKRAESIPVIMGHPFS